MRELVAAINDTLNIAGVLLGNHRDVFALFLPNAHGYEGITEVLRPDVGEWAAILAQSDEPMVFEADETGVLKPIVRKMQYAISGDVQQKVWARDNFKCVYCGCKMGEVTLSIDHFMPLELGGANNPSNYLTACKKQNRMKGNMHPQEWCDKLGISYQGMLDYIQRANRGWQY